MKVLIIEDEPRAANQMKRMLSTCAPEALILQVLDTVEDSKAWLSREHQADLIFMDIQLADGISFEIFDTVQVDTPIIFTTAFDQYAIQAFRVNSLDYLLKPIQEVDLNRALDKFRKSQTPVLNTDILQQLMITMQPTKKRSSVLVKDGSGHISLSIADILYLYSEDSITFAVTATKRYIVEETIDQFYATLDAGLFSKINRGQVVSRSAVIKIEPYFNHRVKLQVQNPRDQEFVVSRARSSEFKTWMNT